MGADFVAHAAVTGIIATLVFDLWNAALQRWRGIRAPRWAILGRWIAAPMSRQLIADPGVFSVPERLVGTLAHYLTGIAFAAVLHAVAGAGWTAHPTLAPALAVGICTVVLPFFVLMPVLGHGVAASRTPHPNRVRVATIISHIVLGLGLFLGAVISSIRA